MLHFSTLEIDPIRLKFQSSKKSEPLSIAKYLQCRSKLATYVSTLLRYVIVIEEEIDSLGSAPTRSNECSRGHHRFSSSDHTSITPSTRLPCQRSPLSYHHARFICIFIPVSLLCAYTKRAYTPISYQFRGNQKAPGCFPAAPTFKHNLERSNAINLKREGNGGLFSGVLRP